MRFKEKEETLLEKDLIFEQSTTVTKRVNVKVKFGKDDSLVLSKKVNSYPRKIKDTTRKMMSLVSELAMTQAKAMQLQHEIKGRESELEQCYRRMELEEPPSDMIHIEWLKLQRSEEQKRRAEVLKPEESYEQKKYELPTGFATTAEPRPNAYIPDDEGELPIPRPYGSLAPFKPTEPGSSMRHIRKPILNPIEI